MNKKLILNKIIKKADNKNIRFPSQMDFRIEGNRLMVCINAKGVTANMQTDGSAFEGWIICIMAWLSDEVKEVILAWDVPSFGEDDKNQKLHYNRFIFRAMMFEDVFSWVTIAPTNRDEIHKISEMLPFLVVNYPKSKSKEKVSDSKEMHKGEAILERQLVDTMKEMVPITDHQLPVGLFKQIVKSEHTVTPRGASQIDIWQLDHGIIRIFELKDEDNNSVGIISELMFYVYVMYLLVKGTIKYPDSLANVKNNYRHINDLYLAIASGEVKSIEAVFLNFRFHPLIEIKKGDVIRIINDEMKKIQVHFNCQLVTQVL